MSHAPWKPVRMEDINFERMNQLVHAIGVQQEMAISRFHSSDSDSSSNWSPDSHIRQGTLERDGSRKAIVEIDVSFYAAETLSDMQIEAVVDRFQSVVDSIREADTSGTADGSQIVGVAAALNARHNDLESGDVFGDNGHVGDDEDELLALRQKRASFLQNLTAALSKQKEKYEFDRLVLSHNRFTVLPSRDFLGQFAPHLVSFEMTNCHMSDLGATLSVLGSALPSLQKIDLSYNSLGSGTSSDHENLLAPFRQLREIHLQGNGLTLDDVRRLIFGATVQVINLSRNAISGALPAAMFQNAESLRELVLSENKITELPSVLFDRAYKTLELLQAGSNRIHALQLPQDVSTNENKCALEELDLGGNELEALPDHMFSFFNGLKTVYLHSNQLSSLPSQGLAELGKQITTFTIHGNQFPELPDAILELRLVECLYWQNNKLRSLPGGDDFGLRLSHVRELDLSNNELETLPASVGQMTMLDKLILDDNKLQTLPNDLANLDLSLFSVHNNPELKLSPLLQRTVNSRM